MGKSKWLGYIAAGLGLMWLFRKPISEAAYTAAAGAGMVRGIRNNNPGNLKPSGPSVFHGQTGLDADGFAIFNTAGNGIRALMLNADHIYTAMGANTLAKLAAIWAPSSENNTVEYAANLAQQLFHDPTMVNEDFNPFNDPVGLAKAITTNENGTSYYPETTFQLAADSFYAYINSNVVKDVAVA